jgi:phosphoribosylanthranilate isomerase
MYAFSKGESGTLALMWVKICGITNEEDALLAVALGADALGFIFAPGSPRQVMPETVAEILHRLPAGVITVGVFRDEQKERVVEVVNGLGLGGAQLHGREPLSDVRFVRRRVPFVIQAFQAGDPAIAAVANGPVDIVLVDADEPGAGTAFDWALADAVPPGVHLLLAGGLHPDNVGAAIRRVRPWGVDVATGVETTPGSGRKDARKLRRFIEEARRAGDELDSDDAWTPDPSAAPYDWMSDGA